MSTIEQPRTAAIPAPVHATYGRFVVYDQLAPEYGIRFTRAHLRNLEAEGKFPRRIQLSERRVAWLAADIDNYMRELAAKSGGTHHA